MKVLKIERRGRKKIPISTKIIVFGLLGLTLLVGTLALWGWITGVLVDVQPLSKAILEEDLDVDFLVIREEHRVAAPFSGKLELLAKDGEKVPKGTVVAYLHKEAGTSLEATSKIPLIAPVAGIFSMQLDGLESICNPKVWAQIDVHKLPTLEKGLEKNNPGNASGREQAVAGTPLFKIVDNLSPTYLFLESDQLNSDKIQKGRSIELRLPELAELPIQGYIVDFFQEGGQTKLLLEITSMNDIEKFRRIKGKLILANYEGIIISENMLVSQNGLSGVYLMQNGRASWQEITIRGIVDKKVAVAGLEEGQWIISTPNLVKEGQRVFRAQR